MLLTLHFTKPTSHPTSAAAIIQAVIQDGAYTPQEHAAKV